MNPPVPCFLAPKSQPKMGSYCESVKNLDSIVSKKWTIVIFHEKKLVVWMNAALNLYQQKGRTSSRRTKN